MPRLQFEYKVTVANLIQIALILLGGFGVYFTLANATANATKDIADLKPAVFDLQSTSATFNTRLTVVESRAETQAVKMTEMAKAIEQLTQAMNALTVTAATTKTDVGYVRDWIEEQKREARNAGN